MALRKKLYNRSHAARGHRPIMCDDQAAYDDVGGREQTQMKSTTHIVVQCWRAARHRVISLTILYKIGERERYRVYGFLVYI